MKICTKCGLQKDESDFYKDKSTKDGYRYHCKKCDDVRVMKYRTTQDGLDRYKRNKVKVRERYNEWFQGLKSNLKCEICGENHPSCLDFHHIDPDLKEFSPAAGYRKAYNRKKVLEEMAKCKVLCSNCHRKLHYAERQKT